MTLENEAQETRRAEHDAAAPHSRHGLSERDQSAIDRHYAPASENDTEVLQNEKISDSNATDGVPEAESDVEVLPGTGGPDDYGDVEIDPDELNMSGDSIPGHPKPANHPH